MNCPILSRTLCETMVMFPVIPLETQRGCASWRISMMEMKQQPLRRFDEVQCGPVHIGFTSALWASFMFFSSAVHLPQAGVQEEVYRPL